MVFPEICQLDTPRLRLRKLRLDDASLYYSRIGSRQEITKNMLWEPHRTPEESEASIRKALQRYSRGSCYRWAIAMKDDDSIIGIIELLRFDTADSSCSFAYMLCPEFWDMGYGTEALRAVIAFAFSRMEVQRIEADHFADNPASGAVMRKAGMRYLGVEPAKYEKNSRKIDAECYLLRRSEWRENDDHK
ncbi:MAG: GNAT family N-acetyltransferase [Clostridia bacterium]|nr:GNAT family N-acetyltransferase [Clostridia bacterium]